MLRHPVPAFEARARLPCQERSYTELFHLPMRPAAALNRQTLSTVSSQRKGKQQACLLIGLGDVSLLPAWRRPHSWAAGARAGPAGKQCRGGWQRESLACPALGCNAAISRTTILSQKPHNRCTPNGCAFGGWRRLGSPLTLQSSGAAHPPSGVPGNYSSLAHVTAAHQPAQCQPFSLRKGQIHGS